MNTNNELNIPSHNVQAQETTSKTSNKWLVLSLIILTILSLSLAAYFGLQNIQLKNQVNNITPTPPTASHATTSPLNQANFNAPLDSKRISYISQEGLVVSDKDGNNKIVVFNKSAPYFSWDWNPTANEVVASNGILKNIDTNIEKKVPSGRCHNWSPDGKKIAYEHMGGIYYIEVSDLTSPTKIANSGSLCGGSNSVSHWLPDSSSLIYLTNNNALINSEVTFSIIKYNINTNESEKIYQEEKGSGQIRSPSISPDGKKIVFMMSIDKGTNTSNLTENVYTINIDGSNLTQLTDLESESEYGQNISTPIFNIDSKNIFILGDNTNSKYLGLSVLDIQTKNITSLAKEAADSYSPATISPDGKYVAYGVADKAIVVDLQTKEKTVIAGARYVLWQK